MLVLDCPEVQIGSEGKISELVIQSGAGVWIGAPAVPHAPSLVRALAEVMRENASVVEAHIPQVWAKSAMREAAPVVVVILAENEADSGQLKLALQRAILLAWAREGPRARHLDIWFLKPNHSMLEAIRTAACKIK
jgi:hypothetical protein